MIINQFLIASVRNLNEEEDQENIDENDFRDLQYLKSLFIQKLFC